MTGFRGQQWRRPATLGLVAGILTASLVLVADDGRSGAAPLRAPPAPQLIERHGPHGERLLARLDGFLTAPSRADAATVARDYIRRRRRALGLGASGLRSLQLVKRTVSPARVTYLRFVQEDRGIPVFRGGLDVAVSHDGRVVRVSGTPVSEVRAPSGRPRLTPAGAALRAAAALRTRRPRPADPDAELVLLRAPGTATLGWRVLVDAPGRGLYDVVLADRDGRVVERHNLQQADSFLRAHANHPQAALGGTSALENVGAAVTASDKLQGPTAHAYADLDGDNIADAGEEVGPSGPSTWDWPRQTVTSSAALCPFGCTWNHLVPNSWRGTADAGVKQAATQAFFFVATYLAHLAGPNIGFSDANDGFGPADPIQVEVLDTADVNGGLPGAVNNANFQTPKDGFPPRMQTYLWQPLDTSLIADIHSGDDAGIVYHEIAHGLSSRLVTDSSGVPILRFSQSGALGEGWSDFMALSYLESAGLRADTAADGELDLAPYESGGGGFLRNAPPDCPVTSTAADCSPDTPAGAGGFTYADYGKISGAGPEVHADGELWAQTLWDLRADLGAATTEQLVVEGMRLAPDNPSFLDARDAILQADTVLGAPNRAAIWEVFAGRGMGYFASAIDGNDDDPVADFTLPPDPSDPAGSLSGAVTDAQTGVPVVGAPVSIGGHDSGFPFSQTVTTDANGVYSFPSIAVGTYPALVLADPRYERVIARDVAIVAGAQSRPFHPRRNWAWAGVGGSAVRSVDTYAKCPGAGALDGDFNTGWCDVAGASRTLEFMLPSAVNVTQVAIDPRARMSDNSLDASASAGDYVVETAQRINNVPGPWRLAASGTFTSEDNEHLVALDPTAAQHLAARYVRVTVSSSQDPSPGGSGQTYQGLAEVQVYATVNQRPTAAIAHTPAAPRAGDTVTFSAAGSSDPDGTITDHDWDLDGNGTFERHTGTSAFVARAYDEPTDISVRVRVTDDDNDTRIATETLSVAGNGRILGLGRLGGDTSAGGRINAIGQIAGESDATPGSPSLRAFRWEAGTLSDLGSTSTRSIAFSINAGGQSVGHSFATGTDRRATLFPAPGTPPVDLGTFGGAESNAGGINDAGTVVGWAQLGTPEAPRRAFVRQAGGSLTPLGTFDASPGASDASDAWDINTAGHVVGWAQGNGVHGAAFHAFLWTGAGALVDLGTIGGRWSIATSINAGGAIGGYGEPSSLTGIHAWVRSPSGVKRDLGTFGGGESVLRDLDNKGRAVGYARRPDGSYRAFLWKGGGLIDLNTLLPPESGWELLAANGINEADQISGWGKHDGVEEGFLLDLGACRICVADIELEQQDVPSGTWTRVPASGTYDGNRVRVTATLENTSTTPQAFNVRFIDTWETTELPGSATAEALDPGESTTVQYEWDTDGDAWDLAGTPASDRGVRVKLSVGPNVLDERVHALKIKPRPVFLVHGLWSDASTWAAYPAMLEGLHPDYEVTAVQGMDTGQQLSLSHEPNTIYENAEVLDGVISDYRAAHEAQRVDLIGHSMGGLISRMWINTFMPDSIPPTPGRPVARHLIQLGTPNMGSACADVLFRADAVELRRSVAAEFNTLVTDRKGVRFSVAVGTPLPFTCIDPTPGDSVVSQTSAEWEIDDHVTNALIHTDMTSDPGLFADFVAPRLDGTEPVAAPAAAPLAPLARVSASAAVAVEPPELTDGDVFTMSAGATRDFTALIGDGTRVGFVIAAPPGVGAQLIAPDTTVAAAIAAGSPEANRFIRSAAVDAPADGVWTVRLTNTGAAAPVSAQVFEAGSALTLAMDGDAIDFRRRSTIRATLRDGVAPVTGATVSGTVRKADGSAQVLRLVDDGSGGDGTAGDGVYTGRSGALGAGPWLLVGNADLLDGRRRMTTGAIVVPLAAPAAPAVGPLAGRVAFSRARDGRKHIFTIAATGGTARRITDGAVTDEGPAWSPDGSKIAFARKVTGGSFDLWVVGADGTGLTQLTSTADEDTNPAWSPGGTHLVFARGGDLWKVAANGTGAVALTSDGAAPDDNRPAWSPDGTTIAFDRTVSGNADLVVVPAAGGAARPVLAAPDQQTAPDWTPDGRDLLYSDSAAGIRLVDASSGGVAPVRAAGANAAFAPGGDRVVYQSGTDLFVAKTDGTAGTALMSDTLVQTDPDWTAGTTEPPVTVPSCPDTSAQTARTGSRTALVVIPCADRDDLPATVAIVTPPAHGTLGALGGSPPNTTVTYTPAALYDGPDSFTYKATNAVGDSAIGTATIEVRPFATDDPHVDRTFGVQGHVLTAFSGGGDRADAVAVQPDGKLVVAGYAGGAPLVARYLPDGTLDGIYGSAGRGAQLPGVSSGALHSVTIDGSGRAVVVGYTGGSQLPVLARYTASGALDTTFSGDGVLPLGGQLRIFYDVAMAPGGAIVVAGAEYQGTGKPLVAVMRATDAGVLDTTFSGDGFATLTFPTTGGLARGVAVEPDGQIVVAGEAQTYPTSSTILLDTGVGRFNVDGTPDARFGTAGSWVKQVSVDTHDLAEDVALDQDGRILVGGETGITGSGGKVYTLSRLTSAGVPDGSFAGGGSQVYGGPFQAFPFEDLGRLALEADGAIWAGGGSFPATDVSFQMTAARFSAGGVLDAAFSGDGYATTYFNPAAIGRGAVLQSPGKLVVAGAAGNPIALTRFSTVPFVPAGGGAHAPVCSDGAVSAYADEATTITFSCSDADGDALTFAVSGGPAHGTLTDLDASAGTAVYHPAAGYLGGDEVTFGVSDPSTRSAGGRVAITVVAKPPPPPPPPPPPTGGGGTSGGGTGTTTTPTGGGGGGTTAQTGGTTTESGGGRSCQVGSAGCSYPVSCPPNAAGTCNGDASNQTGSPRSASVVVRTAASKVLFARVKFAIAAGKKKTLKLKLTTKGKRLLRKKKKVKTVILVRFKDRAGHQWVRRGTVTFKQRPARR